MKILKWLLKVTFLLCMKILKWLLKVTFLLCSSCQTTVCHPRNPSTHIHACLYSPWNHHQRPLFQRESCNSKWNSRLIVFIVWFYLPASIHKSTEQDPRTAHLFTAWHCFPILLEWWIILVLSSPCPQRASPAFAHRALEEGQQPWCCASEGSFTRWRTILQLAPCWGVRASLQDPNCCWIRSVETSDLVTQNDVVGLKK